jgi:nucleoside-diphosphate-sugar epimerase
MMGAPLAGLKRLVIVGATGMVGGYAVRYALEHPAVGRLTVIGRKELGMSHLRLKEVLHRDFANEVKSAVFENRDIRDYYGPHVTNQLIHEALHPYPDDLVIVTKVGATGIRWIRAWSLVAERVDRRGLRQPLEPGRRCS